MRLLVSQFSQFNNLVNQSIEIAWTSNVWRKNHNTHPMNAILSASLYKTLDVLCHGSRLGIFQIQSSENAAKYRGVQFSTDNIIIEVQCYLHTLYVARTLTSTQWKGDLHWALAMGFVFRPTVPRAPRVVRWSTHSPAWFKPNSDGSSLGNPRPAEAAGIIQDADGHVRFAYQVALGTRTNVIAELTAVWCGLEFALAHGLAPIVVQVDATTMIRLLQSRASGKGRCNI
ncbi:UNVERIFIED_CONTAM: hypothetical protein Scaly_2376800 [Sesamum calycinum]|uniref:RNase H type-1 domain-containing protein n=1 Tax=Sesamum calycinum TaxID=2727403 RepID=A0AAW2LZ20_9LAMI